MTVGYKGERIDLLIKQGCDFSADGFVTLNGSSVDLSGSAIHAYMKRGLKSLEAPIDFVCFVVDPMAGQYSISLDHNSTSLLGCSEIETDPMSRYEWEMLVVEASGRKSPLAYGTVYLNRNL